MGRTVFGYADEIFSLGRELVESVKGSPPGGRCVSWWAWQMECPS
jgi:hypothetical protein